MTLDLTSLRQQFPATQPRAKRARTGHIPMAFVEQHLAEIKQIVGRHNLRRRYIGPRYKGNTVKSDAVAMVLYKG